MRGRSLQARALALALFAAIPLTARAGSYTVVARVLAASGTIKGGAINCYDNSGTCVASFTAPQTFTAIPDTGYAVDHWSGCTASADLSTCSVPGTASIVVYAYFKTAPLPPPPTYYLLNSRILSASGTVSASGINSTSINCTDNSGTCQAQEPIGGTVTLKATPAQGFTVQGWMGCTPSSDLATCTVTMTAPAVVDTYFVAQQSCTVPNGTGTQTWDVTTSRWSSCTATACDAGYVLSAGTCSATTAGTGTLADPYRASPLRPTCSDYLTAGLSHGNGMYQIQAGAGPETVYCDMTTGGGGWTNLDFASNRVLLANGIFVSCTQGLTYTTNSITCNMPYFNANSGMPLYHFLCNGSDSSANYILDDMAPLLGYQGSAALGFTSLSQSFGKYGTTSDGTHEYCYINGEVVLWSDPRCLPYSASGNGNCIPNFFTLTR